MQEQRPKEHTGTKQATCVCGIVLPAPHLPLDGFLIRPQRVVHVQHGQDDGDNEQGHVQTLDLAKPESHICLCA